MVQIKDELREKYDFPVEREELFTSAGIPVNRDAIVRTDEGKIVGVMSHDSYQLITHAEAMDAAVDLLENTDGWALDKVKLISEGGVMESEFVSSNEYEIISEVDGKPDSVRPSLKVINTYNGRFPLDYLFGGNRKVCSNGMRAFKSIFSLGFKHVYASSMEMLRQDLVKALGSFEKDIEYYQMMANVQASKKAVLDILKDEKIAINIRFEAVNQMFADGFIDVENRKEFTAVRKGERKIKVAQFSMWYLYNVMTYVLTHKLKSIDGNYTRDMAVSRHFENLGQ